MGWTPTPGHRLSPPGAGGQPGAQSGRLSLSSQPTPHSGLTPAFTGSFVCSFGDSALHLHTPEPHRAERVAGPAGTGSVHTPLQPGVQTRVPSARSQRSKAGSGAL